jgi:hypothetical protein
MSIVLFDSEVDGTTALSIHLRMWVVTPCNLFSVLNLPPTLSPTSLMARLFSSQIPSPVTHQHPSNLVHSTHAYLPVKMEQTECLKRRHLIFRHRGITQKKTYNKMMIVCVLHTEYKRLWLFTYFNYSNEGDEVPRSACWTYISCSRKLPEDGTTVAETCRHWILAMNPILLSAFVGWSVN